MEAEDERRPQYQVCCAYTWKPEAGTLDGYVSCGKEAVFIRLRGIVEFVVPLCWEHEELMSRRCEVSRG